MRRRVWHDVLMLLMVSLAALTCRKDDQPCTTCPPAGSDTTKPGKRDYVWSIDSVDYGNLPSLIQLESIWGSSATDVWGAAGDAPDVRDCLWHYDGTKWSRATDGTPITENTGNKVVYDIWGSARNDVWAVGRKINQGVLSAFLMHYDGSHWYDATPGNVASLETDMYDVYGVSTSDIWVGGYEYALHYDGSSWNIFKIADSVIVHSITSNSQRAYLDTYNAWGKDSYVLYELSGGAFLQIDSTTSSPRRFGSLLWATDTKMVSFEDGVVSTSISSNGDVDTSSWKKEFTSPMFLGQRYVQSRNKVFAVGAGSLVYQYNGIDWKQIFVVLPNNQTIPEANFWGVWADGKEVFICDWQNGIVYHGR